MTVGENGSPDSGPSSGSGGSDGGKVTAASGGGEPETSAGACESGQACGVGEVAPIVPLGAADFGTTVSAETRQAGVGMIWCVFHAERRVMVRIIAPPWMSRFRLCCRDGGLR